MGFWGSCIVALLHLWSRDAVVTYAFGVKGGGWERGRGKTRLGEGVGR